jgi:catechol 2,3-dioxygenase-like lactoylglutathione lyase family enzyme
MPVRAFDHVAMPTADPEGLIAFYKRLGFDIVNEDEWRAGKARAFALAFGDNKINVHPPAVWQDKSFTLRDPSAVPGCGDFCFVWDGSLEALTEALRTAEAEVITGPVPRQGGRGLGRTTGTSLYARDPDGNLLEFIVYG